MDNELESIKAWLVSQGLPTTVDGPGGLSGLHVRLVDPPSWAAEVEAESRALVDPEPIDLDTMEAWERVRLEVAVSWGDAQWSTSRWDGGWSGPLNLRVGAPSATLRAIVEEWHLHAAYRLVDRQTGEVLATTEPAAGEES